ncbi:MAG: hypothetical protein FJZ47_08960 [Candidatus Tectomicrobia bacterium]|uniref:Uncharacterized protein n=1 Tax=Tectimicrobiota bacterium TaxID=2528274 RepID=A0A937W2D3_UNCTE|nr:hypothetical protein [Candidatus Tectomicrobia bacterium]
MLSCTTYQPVTPSPLPQLGALEATARAHVVQARTTSVQTLAALLGVSYRIGPQQGTFDLIVNYAAPDRLRFTAVKDTVLSTQILFDLQFIGTTYRLYRYEDSGPQVAAGTVDDFVERYPNFRTFFLVGEAFFLPGIQYLGGLPHVNTAGTRLTTSLRSGARARWHSRADTLEITRGCITAQTLAGRLPLTLDYQDYRLVDSLYLPHRVVLSDPRLGFTALSLVKQVEVNVPLAPDAFASTP